MNQSLLARITIIILSALLAGCESMRTVIVNVDYDVEVSGTDEAGLKWQAPSSEIKRERHEKAASPFPNVRYDGRLVEWKIGAGPKDFGYFFRSKTDEPVCFRFDQAQMTSNFQRDPKPLRITWARYGPIGGQIMVMPAALRDKSVVAAKVDTRPVAPTVCAAPDKGTTFGFVVDASELFPSGQLFNINQAGKELDYTERGTGNWWKISVPIEHGGKREQIEATFTARGSKARNSYH
jgi:hypothetical protein